MEQIQDSGIVTKVILHGNTSQVVTIFSKNHGMVNGYIKGGAKKSYSTVGNVVEFVWQARVTSHLGNLEVGVMENFSTIFISNIAKITIVQTICEILNYTMKEADQHIDLFENILQTLKQLKKVQDINELANLYIQFEILLFNRLGFGFNFKECNISGGDIPEFISPKTGNAVSKKVATGYEKHLFKIPDFILENNQPHKEDVQNMFNINLHFLYLHFGKRDYNTRNFLQNLFYKLCV